jgi:hypothetical protein
MGLKALDARIRMAFQSEDHDVTCLCALVDLPKRCIVEVMPPREGRARFQLQAFTEGAVGEALVWVAPLVGGAAGGARIRRWSASFEFARLDVDEGETARALRRAFAAASAASPGGLAVAFDAEPTADPPAERLAFLARALGARA